MDAQKTNEVTRREFMVTTTLSASALAAGLARAQSTGEVAGSDRIRIGLVGCGGRGAGATMNALAAADGVEVVAMGDLFPDRLASSLKDLTGSKAGKDKIHVPADRRFTGFDAYKHVLACDDVNYVILATPPAWRPTHLAAAINAGKHVFTEKPIAVDPTGIRSVMETADEAKRKGLALVAGTQRRHKASYIETIKRLHDGVIGDIVGGACSWNQGGLWVVERKPEMTDMEWQCRNWLYFSWLSGDHIVEQHVHNIDVINWVMQNHPVRAMAMGGRQVRTDAKYGNVFDHFAVEFTYPNDVVVMSTCRQIDGCSGRVDEWVRGTKGFSHPGGQIEGAMEYTYPGKEPRNFEYQQEHADLIAGIRQGEPLNEGRQVAESTLCAIMGRMSAYTGRAISWDWAMKSSKLDLVPKDPQFGPHPVDPVAVPGQTELV